MKYANDNIILPYKNRKLDLTAPVRIYRNLNKKGVWYSIIQNGKTVAHTSAICLKDCQFIVSEKGRLRVIKNKRKEFHAYITGIISPNVCGTTAKNNDLPGIIKYDPFKYKGFTCINLSQGPFIVKKANWLILNETGVKAAYLVK